MGVLFVGTVALDSLETPFGSVKRVAGGSALYGSLAASYFTKPVNLVAVVGDDFPDGELQDMRGHGINLDGLQVKKGEKSFFWEGRYHMNMNARDTLTTDLNVLASFDPVIPSSYQDCDFLMLGNLTPAIQKLTLNRLDKRPSLIVLDTMNYWMNSAYDELMEVIAEIDVLTINEEEARQLSGQYSLVKAAKEILLKGPKFLIIKKGENGALLFSKDEVFYAPGMPLEEVIDPTGAGDAFAGGFIGYLAGQRNTSFETLKKAVIHGSALASFCVEKFGTQKLKFLTPKEIEDRVNAFVSLSTFAV